MKVRPPDQGALWRKLQLFLIFTEIFWPPNILKDVLTLIITARYISRYTTTDRRKLTASQLTAKTTDRQKRLIC